MNITVLMSNRVNDARVAMAALIEARAIPYNEGEPGFPQALAALAWEIADAMSEERANRTGKRSIPPPPSTKPRGGR